VVVAAFWRTILKIGIAAIIVGFVFLLATSLLEIVHTLHTDPMANPEGVGATGPLPP
jgi:hypothetical protein